MAYVSSFTYCETIQTEITEQGTRYQIVNPLSVLAPVSIPGNYSFAISCNIAGFDVSKENSVSICFFDQHGSEIYNSGSVAFDIPAEHVKDNEIANIQFNIDIRNLVFKESGLYVTKVLLNADELGEYKIQVIKGDIS